ncbi:helix-turn-helix transcriptional regulator [Candidatus Magnetaquicoccus inordinatus]|uniref:helix-turn-helix transcriptional regulator n=1 Tax=Candidatus Magnetaquicoccus inordinatus TaxID=2496818 RepID=UPI001D0EC53D|nr:helix-turn-helix domain-containing protein [Candidatus Magnetaquicoccus inordinatus]
MRREQAAEYLGLAVPTLEKMAVRGDGPPFAKLGRPVIYRKSDLDAWIAARVIVSTSQAPKGRGCK